MASSTGTSARPHRLLSAGAAERGILPVLRDPRLEEGVVFFADQV